MAYEFNFDLSSSSQAFFREVAKFSKQKNIHNKIGSTARFLVDKFRIDKIVGIPVSDALILVEDMLDTYVDNLSTVKDFKKTKKRALLLPHCSRKYMDSKCKAKFDVKNSSYRCVGCSSDCLVNKATRLGKERNYDVYVLPGGSCIRKILNKNYDGIVGVACCEEIKLAKSFLKNYKVNIQGVPLIKNGCSKTKFSIKSLEEVLIQ